MPLSYCFIPDILRTWRFKSFYPSSVENSELLVIFYIVVCPSWLCAQMTFNGTLQWISVALPFQMGHSGVSQDVKSRSVAFRMIVMTQRTPLHTSLSLA